VNLVSAINALDTQANVRAFLCAIKHTEGTDPNPHGHDPYRTVYGYGFQIAQLTHHPADPALGPARWPGEELPAHYCRQLGFKGKCYSTAAGAFQMIWPTWDSPRRVMQLADFSPRSQDLAAVWILERCGALSHIVRGEVVMALQYASREWASLPWSTSGQPKYTIDRVHEIFAAAGGSAIA
jgi:lysozyme